MSESIPPEPSVPPEAEEATILRELEASEPYRRYEAAILVGTPAFGIVPTEPVLAKLVRLLNDDTHDHVTAYVADALGNLNYKRAEGDLQARLKKEVALGEKASMRIVTRIVLALEKMKV